jgi:hypothetical protein
MWAAPSKDEQKAEATNNPSPNTDNPINNEQRRLDQESLKRFVVVGSLEKEETGQDLREYWWQENSKKQNGD